MRLPLSGIAKQRAAERKSRLHRALIHFEGKKGGQLFGPIPEGHRREFFCLDAHTWVWHEEWTDANGKHHAITTRYDVRPNTVLKSQGVMAYQALSSEERRHFFDAVRMYGKQIEAEYGRMLGTTA